MKHVSILVPESSVMQAIADPQYCFASVNQFMEMKGKDQVFKVDLVGLKKRVKLSNGSYCVHADKLINETSRTDLIIIPALAGNLSEAIEANKKFVPWIRKQYIHGAEVASLCLGAFLLASTGLLDGRKCSTHWGFTDLFRQMFPEVDVQDGKIVTDENGIYSSGGANSYWNLLLHLVEKYTDRETAVITSKYFAIDINRHSQSAFSIFSGQKKHHDEVIKKAQEYIEKNIHGRITIEELAERFSVGRRSFERRFKKVKIGRAHV